MVMRLSPLQSPGLAATVPLMVSFLIPEGSVTAPVMFRVALLFFDPSARAEMLRVGPVVSAAAGVMLLDWAESGPGPAEWMAVTVKG